VAKSMYFKFSKPSRLDPKLPFLPHPPKADTPQPSPPCLWLGRKEREP